MECLYFAHPIRSGDEIILNEEESLHAHVLRLEIGDDLLITNGIGTIAHCNVVSNNKRRFVVSIANIETETKAPIKVTLALGLLDSKDRLDFAIEKCIEIGVDEITIFTSRFSQRKQVSLEKLQLKAIATIKQCKRAFLPKFNFCQSVVELIEQYKDSTIFFADQNATNTALLIPTINSTLLVGPEGGFDENETKLILAQNNVVSVSLGKGRLRAETACIAMSVKALL